VTHDYAGSGGVSTMTRFLHRALQESEEFEPEIISLALSSSDRASARVLAPGTWSKNPRVMEGTRDGVPFRHVGARACELEFQRYRPRRALTELLLGYDLVQVVAGTPPWFCATEGLDRPRFLWTATTTRADRQNRLNAGSPARRLWLRAMTRMAERYERRALLTASEVFALSDYTLASARRLARKQIGVLAACGVDTELFCPGPTKEGKYLLCVGRLDDPRKNISLLMEAYARLCETEKNAPELWLAGPKPSGEVLNRIRGQPLQARVRCLGHQTASELVELYRSATCFVLSSDEEGMGIVLVEAMACGIPVVSTASGGPQSVIEDGRTGFLTPVGDAAAMASALRKLVSDPDLRQRLGRAGRETCVARFSMAAAGRVFLEHYTMALNNRPGAKAANPTQARARTSIDFSPQQR
jgi:D-inositol-3-phosphate glycosyltransferase